MPTAVTLLINLRFFIHLYISTPKTNTIYIKGKQILSIYRTAEKRLIFLQKNAWFSALSVLIYQGTLSCCGVKHALMQEVAALRSGKFLRSMSDFQTGRSYPSGSRASYARCADCRSGFSSVCSKGASGASCGSQSVFEWNDEKYGGMKPWPLPLQGKPPIPGGLPAWIHMCKWASAYPEILFFRFFKPDGLKHPGQFPRICSPPII